MCLCVYCIHVVPCAVIMLHNNDDIVYECVSVCWCFYRHSGSSLFIFLPWYIPNIYTYTFKWRRKLILTVLPNLLCMQQTGMTALLYASLKGHLPVVRELVDVYSVNVFQMDKIHVRPGAHHNLYHTSIFDFIRCTTLLIVAFAGTHDNVQ